MVLGHDRVFTPRLRSPIWSVLRRKPHGPESPLLLRVVGRLPWLGDWDELGRQASDKPQGRKPRGDQARWCGVRDLWGFENSRATVMVRGVR